jgi:hypothetical protein
VTVDLATRDGTGRATRDPDSERALRGQALNPAGWRFRSCGLLLRRLDEHARLTSAQLSMRSGSRPCVAAAASGRHFPGLLLHLSGTRWTASPAPGLIRYGRINSVNVSYA